MDSSFNSSSQKQVSRPYSSKQQQQQQQQPPKLNMEISGEGIKKGHKVPEQYRVSAKPIAHKIPEKRSPERIQQQEQFSNNQDQQQQQQQNFGDYMSTKMLNGEVRQIYENHFYPNNNQEEFKKQTSKPFSTCKGRFQSAKNSSQCQANQNPSNVFSNGSTQISGENNSQQQREGSQSSQELNQLCRLTTYSYEDQNLNQIKISDIAQKFVNPPQTQNINEKLKTQSNKKNNNIIQENIKAAKISNNNNNNNLKPKIKFDNKNWVVQDGAVEKNIKLKLKYCTEERKRQMEDLNDYIQKMNLNQKLPKDFDKMVDEAYLTIKENQEDIDMSNSKCFDYEEFKKDQNSDMKKLDLELARQENQDIQRKLEILNKMIDESTDDLSQYSVEDLKSRAAFITDITKSRKFQKNTQQQLKQKKDQDEEEEKEIKKAQIQDEQQELDDYNQVPVSMLKNQNNNFYFIELNKRLAFLKDFDQLQEISMCEKLPQEQQQQLDSLIEQDEEQILKKYKNNPYKMDEQNLRELDDKLRIYKLDLNEFVDEQGGIFDNSVLPKDKVLKDQAENKIIKEKLNYINDQLMNIAKLEREQQQSKTIKAEKMKIQSLCEQLKQQVDYEKSEFLLSKEQDLEELQKINEDSFQLLTQLENSQEIQLIQKDLYQIKQNILYHITQLKKGIIQEQEVTAEQENYEEEKEQYQQLYQSFRQSHSTISSQFKELQVEEQKLMEKVKKWEDDMKLLDKVLDQSSNQQQQQNNDNQDKDQLTISQINENQDNDNSSLQKSQLDQQKLEELKKKYDEKAKQLYPDLFQDQDFDDGDKNKQNENNENQN